MDVNKTINKKKLFISILIVLSVFICLTSVAAQDASDANLTQTSAADVSQATGDLEVDESASVLTSNGNDSEIESASDQKDVPQDKLAATNDIEPLGNIIPVTNYTFKAIQDAIDGAESGDTIYLTPGTYYNEGNGQISIRDNDNITIIGNSTILDAQCQSSIFVIYSSDNLKIQNITFKNAKGAIFWSGNNGGSAGGSVSNCSFVNNTASHGGAICWMWPNGGSVSNCSFVNNTAADGGSAIHWSQGYGSVSGCSFVNNTAKGAWGGAICSDFCWIRVSGCSFVNNTAERSSAAIAWISGGDGYVSGCIFVNNRGPSCVIKPSKGAMINNNIFLDNACPSEIYFKQSDDSSNIDYNWFGNNATDYASQPKTVNVVPNNWLYLNATADPIGVEGLDTSDITFDLFVYNNTSQMPEDKYANTSLLMPVNLTVTAANGNVSKNVTTFGETITYTPSSLGANSVTAQIETATQTVEIPLKGDFDLLQDLIDKAGANSVINLTRNYTYNDLDSIIEGVVIRNSNVTINGNGYTIDAKDQSRIFYIYKSENVTIQNITFKNGLVSGYLTDEGHLPDHGGAVYWSSSDGGCVSGCSFVNNTGKFGGAICWSHSDGGCVSGCSFVNNTSKNEFENAAGAVYWSSSDGGCVSGCSFVNNTARHYGGAILWSGSEGSVSGCIFVKHNAEDSVIYFPNNWFYNNLTINDNIFLDNDCPSEIYFEKSDDSSNIDFNWFGNNATDYAAQPKTVNITANNWLYLNATASPSELSIFDSSDITFDLFVYNNTSQMPEDKYANISLLMPVNLTVTAANGNVSKNVTTFGEKITYTPDKLGTASVTASIENVQDTIGIEVAKDNLTLQATCDSIYYGDNASIVVSGFAKATGEARAYVGDGLYCATIVSGVATFNVPGVIENTTATIEYYGDDNYNNASTWVLIIVGPRDASVSVANGTMELNVDSNGTIIATTSPDGLNVTFASSNESVATVDADGNVVAVSEGTVVITVSVGDDVAYAKNSTTVDVTVTKIPTEINTANETVALKVNEETSAGATLTPAGAPADNLTYTSSDESIAKVENGNIIALAEGNVTVTVSFAGDKKYTAAQSKTITVTVSLNDAKVDVDQSSLELLVGESDTIAVNTDPEGLDVTYTSSDESIVTVNDGQVTAVGEGNATITVSVGGDGVYAENSTAVTVTVSKAGSKVTIEPIDNVVYGEDVTVKYSIENRTDNVSVIVENGEGSQVSDDNIIITDDTVTVTGLDAGDYKITIVNNADYKTKEANDTAMFSVSKFSPSLSLDVSDITYGETEVITITSDITGTVNVTVNGVTVTLELNGEAKEILFAVFANVLKSDNKATLSLDNLKAGEYPVSATYNGDDNYESVTETGEFTVSSSNATIDADSSDIEVGDDETITVNLPEDATGTVTIEIDGTNYTAPVEDGKAVFDISDLSAGDKTAKVYYSGDDNYNPSETTTSFTVNKVKPDVSAQNVSSDDSGKIVIPLPEDATGTVTIEIDGKTYTAPVEDGKVVFDIPGLAPGKHDIRVCYSGDDKYEAVEFDATITVEGNGTNPENETVSKVAAATDESTGNPILMLLIALMAIGPAALRKPKK